MHSKSNSKSNSHYSTQEDETTSTTTTITSTKSLLRRTSHTGGSRIHHDRQQRVHMYQSRRQLEKEHKPRSYPEAAKRALRSPYRRDSHMEHYKFDLFKVIEVQQIPQNDSPSNTDEGSHEISMRDLKDKLEEIKHLRTVLESNSSHHGHHQHRHHNLSESAPNTSESYNNSSFRSRSRSRTRSRSRSPQPKHDSEDTRHSRHSHRSHHSRSSSRAPSPSPQRTPSATTAASAHYYKSYSRSSSPQPYYAHSSYSRSSSPQPLVYNSYSRSSSPQPYTYNSYSRSSSPQPYSHNSYSRSSSPQPMVQPRGHPPVYQYPSRPHSRSPSPQPSASSTSGMFYHHSDGSISSIHTTSPPRTRPRTPQEALQGLFERLDQHHAERDQIRLRELEIENEMLRRHQLQRINSDLLVKHHEGALAQNHGNANLRHS